MPISVSARFGALIAAATIATTGVMATGVAEAATHPAARLSTSLSIKASTPKAVRHHTVARIAGQLTSGTSPLRFKVVWLERQGPHGHWIVVQRERTHRHGWVVYRIRERKTSTFRLVFRGTANFKRAVSSTVSIAAAS